MDLSRNCSQYGGKVRKVLHRVEDHENHVRWIYLATVLSMGESRKSMCLRVTKPPCYFSLGANSKKKNEKDETPYDVALKGGYETVANKFTASLAQNALGKMTKPKSARIGDEF